MENTISGKCESTKMTCSGCSNTISTKESYSISILIILFLIFSFVHFYFLSVSFYLFVGLSLYCLYPIVKKVVQHFKVKFYFSVEFLMTTAVIGALFIHAAQEAVVVMI
ncbi:MAG: hypothetical protein V4591_03190, partial [Bdellovibrionota bacterium]